MLADGTITARIRCAVELDGAAPCSKSFATAVSAARPASASRKEFTLPRIVALRARWNCRGENEMLAGACEPSSLFAAKLSEPQGLDSRG